MSGTHEENMIKDLQIPSPVGKSDHACLTLNYICNKSKITKPWTKYFYDKGNYKRIQELEATNWDELFKEHMDQLGVMYELLNKRILKLQSTYIPSKLITGLRKHHIPLANRN